MITISKKLVPSTYACFLRLLLLIAGIPLILGPFFYTWFWKGVSTFNEIKFGAMKSAGLSVSEANLIPGLSLKVLAAVVDGVSVILLLLGCIYSFKLLSCYCKGVFFSESILRLYRNIVWIAFIWTLYSPIKSMALSIITTINNPSGQRVLSVTLRGEDLQHILVVGSLLVISLLMKEAYKLKQEQDLTI